MNRLLILLICVVVINGHSNNNNGPSFSLSSKHEEDIITTFFTDGNDTVAPPNDDESSLIMAEYYKFLDENEEDSDLEDDSEDEDDAGGDSMMLSNTFISKRLLFDDDDDQHEEQIIQMRGGGGPSESMKRLIVAALVTLLYEAAIGHLLEFLKIVFQTSPPGTTYQQVFKSITAEKGIAGIWDGFVPWGVIQSIGKGASFGFANAKAVQFLTPLLSSSNPKLLATLAGGIGGGFQGYILSPTLLLKTRVMTNPIFREQMSFLQTTLLSLKIGFDVFKEEGPRALMKGSNVFALKRVFDWSTRYYFSEIFISLLLKLFHSDKLSVSQNAIADFLGGTASTLSTLPLDVLVAKIQDAKKAGVAMSPFEMIMDDLNAHGWSGFLNNYTKGFIARLLHVCFTTIAMKTGTKIMYDAIYS